LDQSTPPAGPEFAKSLTSKPGASSVDFVVNSIKELLLKGTVKPGDRLPPEVELARTLGVGRSKLREALTLWSRMGIVSRNKGAGTVLAAAITGRPLALSGEKSLSMQNSLRWVLPVKSTKRLRKTRSTSHGGQLPFSGICSNASCSSLIESRRPAEFNRSGPGWRSQAMDSQAGPAAGV